MELLFVALAGVIIGLIARYTLPQRHRHGSVLIPAVGTASAAIVWVALTWAGMKWNGGWIWVITFVATAVICAVADLVIGESRKKSDKRMLVSLSNGAATPAE